MRKYIIITNLLLVLCTGNIFAQKFTVIDVTEVSNDLSARTSSRKAPSGKDCALLKINVPTVKNMKFSEHVGDVTYSPGEFHVYVPEGTTSIDCSFTDSGEKTTLDFSKYNIDIKGKTVYKIMLKQDMPNAYAALGSLLLTSNINGAIVLIDGIPFGQVPLKINGIPEGEHTLSIPNTIGYSCPEQKIYIKNGELTKIDLSLVASNYEPIGIEWATPGGDTIGWYQVRTKTIVKNGKMGLFDFTGKELVPCEFDDVYPDLQGGYYKVENNGKYGLYQPGVGLVVECKYDMIVSRHNSCNWFYVKKDGAVGYINNSGEEIIPLVFTNGTLYDNGANSSVIVVELETPKGNLTGVYDSKGKVLVEPRIARQGEFHEGVSVVRKKKDGKDFYFIMDTQGKETILPNVDYIDSGYGDFHNGLLSVRNSEKKWGCINSNGELVIPFKYEGIGWFYGNCAQVRTENEAGKSVFRFIDKKGNAITPELESPPMSMVYDYKVVGEDTAYEWLPTYDDTECYFKICKDGKYGLMNSSGELVLPIKYDEIKVNPFYSNGVNCIEAFKDGENFIYDRNLRYMFSMPDNLFIGGYSDGILQIRDEESQTYGFFNEKGEVLGNCIYSTTCPSENEDVQFDYDLIVGTISEGRAMLVIGDRFGFMDETGKVVVPAIYTAALPYENGETFVRKTDGKWIKIDKNNNQIP